MNNTADVTITGDTTNIYLGNSVSSAGDVNCDGYSDVIAGANGYSSSTGRAYIYFGGSSMNNTADLTMIGDNPRFLIPMQTWVVLWVGLLCLTFLPEWLPAVRKRFSSAR